MPGQQLLRDRTRSLLQLARQLKRRRQGDLPERGLLGLLGLHRRLDPIQRLDSRGKRLRDAFFQEMKHENQISDTMCAKNESVPKVTFTNLGKTVEFESGKLPYDEHGKPESILDVAINFGIQLEHACGGSCACTTCHVIVKSGDDNLSKPMKTSSTAWIRPPA